MTMSSIREKQKPPSDRRKPIAELLYKPLLQGETRLILLYPASEDNHELVADLFTAALTHHEPGIGLPSEDTVVEFDALSYTWGEPDFGCKMILNGYPFPITPNSDEALRHL